MLRVGRVYLNNRYISYLYNDDGQLTSAGDMDYTYDNNGFLTKSSISNFEESYNYNDYGELSSSTNNYYNLSYTYDGIGRIKTITSPDGVTEYFYDSQSRISSVKLDNVEVESYSYDGNGNRLTSLTATATYDAQDRMLTYGDNSYIYDDNGTLLSKTNADGVTTYSYDALGNLLKVVLPDNRVITYQIDARGRRIGKKVDGVFEYGFIYGDQLNPIAKIDNNGAITEKYIYGLRSNIPEYVIQGNDKFKIISNHLGSPVRVVNLRSQEVVKSIKYDTFGNIVEESGSFEIPFRFAGGIWDADTKLIRFGVRDYNSLTGRWLSKEPLGFGGARNFYVYAENDGVNYLDPNGLFDIGWGDYVETKNTDGTSSSSADLIQNNINASRIFLQYYYIMKNLNWRNSDKYFHCKANCETTRKIGKSYADLLSRFREWFDYNFKGDSLENCRDDMKANKFGQDGGEKKDKSCKDVCSKYRPNKLPENH